MLLPLSVLAVQITSSSSATFFNSSRMATPTPLGGATITSFGEQSIPLQLQSSRCVSASSVRVCMYVCVCAPVCVCMRGCVRVRVNTCAYLRQPLYSFSIWMAKLHSFGICSACRSGVWPSSCAQLLNATVRSTMTLRSKRMQQKQKKLAPPTISSRSRGTCFDGLARRRLPTSTRKPC